MLKAKILVLFLVLLAVGNGRVYAQLQPEQDCFGALPVCNTVFQQGNSYTGPGVIDELEALFPNICLINGENNSVWYIFTISTAGSLEFSITPISSNDDYDFALFDLTGNDCADIITGVAPHVRCNYAVTQGVPTGLAAGNTATNSGPNGSAFLAPLTVQVGETYALLIDNFTRNGQGYSINFSAGSAGIADTVAPFLTAIAPLGCDTALTRTLTVTLSEPVKCGTILANGSQFVVSGPQSVSVVGAVGTACATGQTFTTEVVLTLASPIITKGTYYLKAVAGSTGQNVTDICDQRVTDDSLAFNALAIVLPSFTYNIAASCLVDTLNFINTSLPSTTNGNPTWLWDFGDATTSTLQDPAHVFPDTILYNVTLTATSEDGCVFSNDSVIPVDRSYNAVFTYAPAAVCPGVPVQFTDVSPASATTWVWDFGDGNISGNQNPTNTYTAPGSYTVTLVVSEPSAFGLCSDTAVQIINVLPDVTAAFALSANQICQGTPVVFTDQSTGSPSLWRWDFGNGDTSILPNPTYTYDSVGVFTISLGVSNACNVDNATQAFEVFAIPVFNLGNDTAICFDRSVTLRSFPGAVTTWSTGQTGDSIVVVGAPIEVRASVNNNGCTFDDVVIIEELQEGCIIVPVPSAFTPNNDGSNDLWRLVNPQRLISVEVWIFNRWGQQVFYDDNLSFAWDGTYKGEPAEMGVYSYILKGFGESSRGREPVLYKGNLTLIR